jgi:hypothetical protein
VTEALKAIATARGPSKLQARLSDFHALVFMAEAFDPEVRDASLRTLCP